MNCNTHILYLYFLQHLHRMCTTIIINSKRTTWTTMKTQHYALICSSSLVYIGSSWVLETSSKKTSTFLNLMVLRISKIPCRKPVSSKLFNCSTCSCLFTKGIFIIYSFSTISKALALKFSEFSERANEEMNLT